MIQPPAYTNTVSTGGWGTGIVAYNPSDTDCDITITPYTAAGVALIPATDEIAGFQLNTSSDFMMLDALPGM